MISAALGVSEYTLTYLNFLFLPPVIYSGSFLCAIIELSPYHVLWS